MRSAWAHGGESPAEAITIWSAWTLDPWVIVPMLIGIALYWRGVELCWRRAGRGRGVRYAEVAAFWAGIAALALALIWPLDVLGEVLYSAHMAQHLVLMNLAAPLIVLGSPLQVMIRPLPASWQRGIAGLLRQPAWKAARNTLLGVAAATLVQQIALWTWHVPSSIAAALASDAIHITMHATLLAAALLFWTAVLKPLRRGVGAPLIALVVTAKISTLVCIALLLSDRPLYVAYAASTQAWGLTLIEDQQLAWGIMMVFGTASYVAAALVLFATRLLRVDRPHVSA